MLTIARLPNGDLLVTANNAARQYIKENKPSWFELLESYSCNGSFTPFDAGNANPFVGLTSAPCIAECMDYSDDGKQSIIGDFWYFSNYQIADEIEILKNTGRVIFTRG